MESQELNIWLLSRTQTEGVLQSEERRLETVKREYNSEINRFNQVKQSFQNTKLRLIQEKNNGADPAIKLEQDKSLSKRLQSEKLILENYNRRLNSIEGKLKKQSTLVLHNKKKLEMLQERINILEGRKISKKNLREELEIIDGKIQQMAIFKKKLHATESKSKVADKDNEEHFDKDFLPQNDLMPLESAQSFSDTLPGTSNYSDVTQYNPNQENRQQHQHNYQENKQPERNENAASFQEKISQLTHIKNDEADTVKFSYVNKQGNNFELEIKKQLDNGLVVEITAHSSVDTLSLRSCKYEIISNLKEQGYKINRFTIRGAGGVFE